MLTHTHTHTDDTHHTHDTFKEHAVNLGTCIRVYTHIDGLHHTHDMLARIPPLTQVHTRTRAHTHTRIYAYTHTCAVSEPASMGPEGNGFAGPSPGCTLKMG